MNEITTGIDDIGSIRSDVNQVTEEDVQRVQAQSKQAKQIAQQIKKDKAINTQLAKFLSFLMKKIENEEIIQAIVSTFFKVTNPKNQATYLRKDINTYVTVGFFVPFFREEAKNEHIFKFYEKLGAEEAKNSLKYYIEYLKKLSEVYHDNIPIDEDKLISLIILITKEFINNKKNSSPKEALEKEIITLLYK